MSRIHASLLAERRELGRPNYRKRAREVGSKRLAAQTPERERGQAKVAKVIRLPMAHVERPSGRADCKGGPRPCPLVGCRFNLYLDVDEWRGRGDGDAETIRFRFPDRAPEDMPPAQSCALDVADEVGAGSEQLTVEDLAGLLNTTAESVRQILRRAERKVGSRLALLGVSRDDVARLLRLRDEQG